MILLRDTPDLYHLQEYLKAMGYNLGKRGGLP